MKTIGELVRAQVLAEGPQHRGARAAMVYVDLSIDAMDNTELLDRISDALEAKASEQGKDCDACEGSGESVVNFPDGTEASTKTPPCEKCGGSGLKTSEVKP